MNEGEASRTAVAAAKFRAAHRALDAEPRILDDPFARGLAGFDSDEELVGSFRQWSEAFQGDRTVFVVRSRYAEDGLAGARDRGVSQYVVLGAGLDSFALRWDGRSGALRVFEVDHSASQAWKRRRLAEMGVADPAGLRYVPVDLGREALGPALAAGGHDRDAASFFSILGLTQYLERDRVSSLLRDVAAASAPGSEVVVQFQVPPETLEPPARQTVEAFALASAKLGEPWLSHFEPAEMEARLGDAGFDVVERFGARQGTERYLAGRSDGLRLPSHFEMIKARSR